MITQPGGKVKNGCVNLQKRQPNFQLSRLRSLCIFNAFLRRRSPLAKAGGKGYGAFLTLTGQRLFPLPSSRGLAGERGMRGFWRKAYAEDISQQLFICSTKIKPPKRLGGAPPPPEAYGCFCGGTSGPERAGSIPLFQTGCQSEGSLPCPPPPG